MRLTGVVNRTPSSCGGAGNGGVLGAGSEGAEVAEDFVRILGISVGMVWDFEPFSKAGEGSLEAGFLKGCSEVMV